jgi:hypothetical protein
MRAEPDDRLWLMAGTYATVTHEAPRYVRNELRFLRVAARDMHLRAMRHAFEERTARERGDQEAAARHDQREASARAVEERVKAAEARLATSCRLRRVGATTTERWLPLAARNCSGATRRCNCRRCGQPSGTAQRGGAAGTAVATHDQQQRPRNGPRSRD